MNVEVFVQNVKVLCVQKGVKPTNACKESGVGGSFINDIERGRNPSVTKVQMLADYLGVTTSELLGETPKATANATEQLSLSRQEAALLLAYRKADERTRQMVDLALEPYNPPASTDAAM